MTTNLVIPGKLKELRKLHGLSQQEFADRIHVHKMTVSRWERGVLKPSLDDFLNIQDLFHTNMTWFFGVNECTIPPDVIEDFDGTPPSRNFIHLKEIPDYETISSPAEQGEDPEIVALRNSIEAKSEQHQKVLKDVISMLIKAPLSTAYEVMALLHRHVEGKQEEEELETTAGMSRRSGSRAARMARHMSKELQKKHREQAKGKD